MSSQKNCQLPVLTPFLHKAIRVSPKQAQFGLSQQWQKYHAGLEKVPQRGKNLQFLASLGRLQPQSKAPAAYKLTLQRHMLQHRWKYFLGTKCRNFSHWEQRSAQFMLCRGREVITGPGRKYSAFQKQLLQINLHMKDNRLQHRWITICWSHKLQFFVTGNEDSRVQGQGVNKDKDFRNLISFHKSELVTGLTTLYNCRKRQQ